MKITIRLLGTAAPLAILVALGGATPARDQNPGPDDFPGTADDPENSLQCGINAQATSADTTAYGNAAFATAPDSTAVGFLATAGDLNATAIGSFSQASAGGAVALPPTLRLPFGG